MTEHVQRRVGLADFLRSRRARLRPEQFGLPALPKRHTPGLRREELAKLVGVGISWYTWLEQGRDIHVSEQVLARLADVLQLTGEERRHLFILAQGPRELPGGTSEEKAAQCATYRAILDAHGHPAQLIDRRMNVLVWNEASSQLFGDYAGRSRRERNILWSTFMDPQRRQRYVHWEQAARGCLARFHALYDQYGPDTWTNELIADLRQASPEFRAWWPEHTVLLCCNGTGEICHPRIGQSTWKVSTFIPPERPDWSMIFYTPRPPVAGDHGNFS